jgi:receptor expression-enhancing protein 5/6
LQAGKSFKQSGKSSKDSKESKPAKDSKESKSSKDSKEPKASKDAKQPKPSKDLKEQKPSKDLKSPKDTKEQKKAAPKDPKKASLKDSKELKKALKDSKEQEALKDPKEYTPKKRVTFAEVEPEKELKASNSEWHPSSDFHSTYPEQNSWTSSFMIFEDENTYWNQGPLVW